MTEQTPLERLEEAIDAWNETEVADFESGDRVVNAAIAYRDYAEARIRGLEAKNSKREVKYFELMERYEETLGRALGYGGVDMRPVGGDKDGVCLGELPADMLPELAEKRIRELESKLEAWEDAEKIKLNKICGFGRCVFCGSTPSTTPGTYHLKPAEADDEVV